MADATVSVEAKIIDQMSGALRAIQHEMARLEKTTFDSTRGIKKEMDALRESANSSSSALVTGMKRMGGAILGAAAAYATISTAARVAGSSIEASLGNQRIGRGLEFATGSAEAGAKAFGFIRDEAGRLGLDLRSAATEFTKLSAAAKGTALEGRGARDIFVGVSEAATVLGLSSEQAGGALNAIQQMISKGTVAAEELRGQLGERLPGAFQIAARAMGVSTQELGKMLEQGQVISDQFLPKFAAELHKTFGADAVNASKQGQAGINRFHTALYEVQTMLGDALLPALLDVTNEITDLVKKGKESGALAENFRQIAETAMATAKAINTVAGVGARWIAKEADQSKIMRIYEQLRENDPLGLSSDLMQQAQERFRMLKEAAKLADEERKKGFGAPGMGGGGTTAAVAASARALTKDQNEKLLKLQAELEVARVATMEDSLSKRLAIEEAEFQFRLKEAGNFAEARQQIEMIHAQNVENIRADAANKARKKEIEEFRKAQKEAVDQDVLRTKQIEDARREVALAGAAGDEMATLKIRQQQELEAVAFNEAAITELKKAHAMQRDSLDTELREKAKKEEQELLEARIDAGVRFANAMVGVIQLIGKENKAAAEAAVFIAEISAIASTAAGIMKAYEQGGVLGFLTGTAIAAEGAIQIAKINSAQSKFASGTLSAPGGMALVGERGPEMVELPRGARVYNNTETMGMMGGGVTHTGNVVLQIQVSAGATPAQAEEFGRAAAHGYTDYLRTLKRDIKNIEYMNVPDA